MPKGGHGKSGPVAQDAAARALHGSRTRARHRTKGDPGELMVLCAPPPGLSKSERAFWSYYAPKLVAERRLTLKARDTLAKYCTALAVVADLRRALASKAKVNIINKSANRKELRQWLLAGRLYENDLLLNPASAIRAPKPSDPDEDEPLGISHPAQGDDPFSEFDEPKGVN